MLSLQSILFVETYGASLNRQQIEPVIQYKRNMDILKLTQKVIDLASQDESLKEKIKDLVVTIEMVLKNGGDVSIVFSIDHGNLKLIEGKADNPDFRFEISQRDFTGLMTGKQTGMILMATGKLKMVKGNWAEINRIATPLIMIPKLGKQIFEQGER